MKVAVIEVDENNFDKVILGSDVPVMADFFAEWCSPCKTMSSVIDSIADKKASEYKVCKIDIDKSRSLAEKYGIMSIPTVVFFKDGREVNRLVGVHGKDELMKNIIC